MLAAPLCRGIFHPSNVLGQGSTVLRLELLPFGFGPDQLPPVPTSKSLNALLERRLHALELRRRDKALVEDSTSAAQRLCLHTLDEPLGIVRRKLLG